MQTGLQGGELEPGRDMLGLLWGDVGHSGSNLGHRGCDLGPYGCNLRLGRAIWGTRDVIWGPSPVTGRKPQTIWAPQL